MAITNVEREELIHYIEMRACNEYRTGEACVQRGDAEMIGDLHAGCARVREMVEIVRRA